LALAALLAIPLALVARGLRRPRAVPFAPAVLLFDAPVAAAGAPLPKPRRARFGRAPLALYALGLGLLAMALGRPAQREPLPLEHEGIDILLCLDVSSSMAADDMGGRTTRLDAVKDAARRFVAGRAHDRIGLVQFARYADLVCPLTLDHAALTAILAEIELVERDGPEDMTGIGGAVSRAAEVLHRSDGHSQVVVLLTDGEENVARADTPEEIGPLAAARLCEELGVRVYTIAAGTGKRGADGGFEPLDTTQVQALAEITGGAFHTAKDAAAIADVFA